MMMVLPKVAATIVMAVGAKKGKLTGAPRQKPLSLLLLRLLLLTSRTAAAAAEVRIAVTTALTTAAA